MPDINFIIDGKPQTAAPGETILSVARRMGLDIPTLCYNQKISRTTSCFVCVVKDLKTGRFLPSCSACPSEGQQIDASSEEVQDMRRTALNLLLSEHTGDCEAPCTMACPAHASVEEYVREGRKGNFLESLKIIKKRIPLPMSVGRVCPRFCEKDCRKNIFGAAVSINDFKRLAADLHYDTYMEELPALNGKKVAVVGAGPAGFAAAYDLRLAGVAVTMFDKQPEAGGMLRYGIPEFRLPKDTLRRELEHFKKMGVTWECGRELGKNLSLNELKKSYDAVIIAVGSWQASAMRIEGDELAEMGIDWLGAIADKNWKDCKNPGKTLVVGGGNTAMDCTRTAIRLGGEATIVYRRTQKEMPAQAIEIEEAIEEGAKLQILTAPVRLYKKDSGKLALVCQKMELGEPDASGRRKPEPVPGSDFEIEADTVIAAIGQRTVAPAGLAATKRGDVEVCGKTLLCTGTDNVFAAGDCVTGPKTVVESIASAHRTADAVLAFLDKREYTPAPEFNVSRGHWADLKKDDLVFLHEVSDAERVKPEMIPLELRKTTFTEISPTIPAEKIRKEGERCIECSCTAKGDCKLKKYSTLLGCDPKKYSGERPHGAPDTRHPVIIFDRQKCVRCGTCVKVCGEIINKHLLAPMKRGFQTVVGTAFNEGLPLSCKDCGACIEECPVGALDWRFKK